MERSNFKPNKKVKFFLAKLFENGGAESVVTALSFLDMAFVLSRDGKLIAANDRFTDLIGYSHEELSGKEVLIPTSTVDRISYEASKVFVNSTKEAVEQSPTPNLNPVDAAA